MKATYILAIIFGMSTFVLADKSLKSVKSISGISHDDYDLLTEWTSYKSRHHKNYLDSKEDQMRKEIFKKNFEIIREHNKKFENGEKTFKMRLTDFSDWTDSEKQQMFGFKTDLEIKENLDSDWIDFKRKFGKQYKTNEEDEIHKECFRKKLIVVNKHNQKYVNGEVSFKVGLTKFCDWTDEQRHKFFGTKNHLKPYNEINDVPENRWVHYKDEYGKQYSGDENKMRKEIFLKNLNKYREHNTNHYKARVKDGFTMGINQFSDWTDSELHKNLIDLSPEKQFNIKWENYKKKFSKNYSLDEDIVRKGIFRKNLEFIRQHNHKYEEGHTTFKMGANKYADWSNAEMKKLSGFHKIQ